jgi:hypothetical protein
VAGVCLLAYGLYAQRELIPFGGTVAVAGWVEKKRQRDESDAKRISHFLLMRLFWSKG